MNNVNLQARVIQQQQKLGAGQVTGQNLSGDITLGYPFGVNPMMRTKGQISPFNMEEIPIMQGRIHMPNGLR